MSRTIVLLTTLSACTLAALPAAAQRFVYAVSDLGPAIQTSRCAFGADPCPSLLHLVDVDQAKVIGTTRSGRKSSDGMIAASGDGRYLAWTVGFGATLLTFDRETQTFSERALFFGPSTPRVAASPSGATFFVYRPGQAPVHVVGAGPIVSAAVAGRSVAAGATGAVAYVSTDAGVSLIDAATGAVTASLVLAGARGGDVVASPDGATIFVLRSAGTATTDPATLFKIGLSPLQVTAERPVPMAGSLVIAPDGQTLWLSDGNHDVPSPSQPALRSIRSDTLADQAAVTLPGALPGALRSIALTGDGARLVVTWPPYHTIIDTAGAAIVGSFPAAEYNIPAVAPLPAAAPCVFLVTPTAFDVGAGGGSVQPSVPAGAGCSWNATTGDAWLTPIAPPSGVGSATVNITAQASFAAEPRIGTVTIAGQSVTITQAAPPAPPGTPAAPTGVTATVLPGALARLTWSAAAGPAPTGFVVEAGSVPGGQDVVVAPVGLVTTVTGGPLAPGTYYVRVRGINAAGAGLASSDVSFVIAPIPAAPHSVRLEWTTPGAGSLSWSAEFNLIRFRIAVGTASGATNVGVFDVDAALHALPVFSNVLPPGRYFIRLAGLNVNGVAGPPSPEVEIWIGACGGPAAAPSLQVSSGPFVTATVTAASPQPFASYRFFVGTTPGASNVAVVNAPASPASGLLGSGTYYIRAALVNACGVSAPSAEQVLTIP